MITLDDRTIQVSPEMRLIFDILFFEHESSDLCSYINQFHLFTLKEC